MQTYKSNKSVVLYFLAFLLLKTKSLADVFDSIAEILLSTLLLHLDLFGTFLLLNKEHQPRSDQKSPKNEGQVLRVHDLSLLRSKLPIVLYFLIKSSHVSERSHSSLITLSPSFEQLIGLIYHREPHTNPKLFRRVLLQQLFQRSLHLVLGYIHTQLDGGKTFH